MSVFTIQVKELCEWIWNDTNKSKTTIDVIMSRIEKTFNYDSGSAHQLRTYLNTHFIRRYKRFWVDVHRMRERFENKYKDFMDEELECKFKSSSEQKFDNLLLESSTSRAGRSRSKDEDSSQRTQQRRAQQLRSDYNPNILLKAVSPFLQEEAEVELPAVEEYDVDYINKSLAMYMDIGLTKSKYETLRVHNNVLSGNKQLPPYKKLSSAKLACYPGNIEINESGAKIKLQFLLDHTSSRILSLLSTEQLKKISHNAAELCGKWGLDGASSQQVFKQKWSEAEINTKNSDSSVFMVSYVPLKLTFSEGEVLWRNERPSSVRLCRPVEFQFTKETAEKTKEVYDHYSSEISHLKKTSIDIKKKKYNISHQLYPTMIDGKVCNVLTEQKSSASCNICRATPNQMNDLNGLKKLTIREKNYYYGLSTLHCRIRFMECILHVSYNLDFKKTYASGSDKVLKESRKKLIQEGLQSKLSILVDVVKQGHGSTNDGNTARRFFENPKVVAEVTGINLELVERFADILPILTCGRDIDCDKFEEYTFSTAKLFVELYGWYKMPPSVHKVLIHGSRIIRFFGLPIGCLSEEAQEANNKVFKGARANFSRKISRSKSNEDTIHFMLISSDPVISALRVQKEKKTKELSSGAKSLLKVDDTSDENDSESE